MDSNQEKPVLVIKRTRIFGSVLNAFYKYFTNKFFFIRLKFGVKFLECFGSIIIDIYSFDKCDLKKVINIFKNKNLYKEFWYTGNLNEI